MAQREQLVIDRERKLFALRLSQWIWLIFGILEGLIGLRILLKLMGANPDAPFAEFVYSLTDPFLLPFIGLTGAPSAGGSVLETYSIIAVFVYMLLAWVIIRVIVLVAYKPGEQSGSIPSDTGSSDSSA